MELEHDDHGLIWTTTKHEFQAQVTAIAVGGGDLLLLSMVGSGTSVDAIRASCSMGKQLKWASPSILASMKHSHSSDRPDVISTKDQRYKLFKTYLPLIRQSHYILIAQSLLQPQIDDGYVYAIGDTKTPKAEIVGPVLRDCLPVAIFPQWYKWLVAYNEAYAIHSEKVHAAKSRGCVIYYVPLGDHWGKAVKHGLETRVLDRSVIRGTP